MRATGNAHGLLTGAAAGVAATVVMDAAMVAAAWLAPGTLASDKIGPEMIGRWAAGLCRGRWRHDDITTESPVRGELWIGLAAHYVTGISLATVYLEAARRSGRRPRAADGAAYGLATAVLPLLVMFPSMGYGCCGLRSGDPRRVVGAMLFGHAAFGAGLGLWSATRRRG